MKEALQKDGYYDIEDDDFEAIKNRVKDNFDIWGNVRGLPEPKNVWYFHPVKFIEHVQKVLPKRTNELEIYAVADGTVVKTRKNTAPGYGNYVVVEHEDGSATIMTYRACIYRFINLVRLNGMDMQRIRTLTR